MKGHFFPSPFLYLEACSSSGVKEKQKSIPWLTVTWKDKQFMGPRERGGGTMVTFLAYAQCFLKLGPINIPLTWSAFSCLSL